MIGRPGSPLKPHLSISRIAITFRENRFHTLLPVHAALFPLRRTTPYVEEICRAHIRCHTRAARGVGMDKVDVMHKVNTHQMRDTEPDTATPCRQSDDPDRWFPEGQLPDPTAVADCWGCPFQSQCALRALTLEPKPEHGIWGGYRLAPGPGLSRSRKQLRIIAGLDIGPAASPGVEVSEELLRRRNSSAVSASATDTDTDTEHLESDTEAAVSADAEVLDHAELAQLNDIELRAATAEALVDAITSGDTQTVSACKAEAQRRGKPCIFRHAHAEISWGPEVAEQLQRQCCAPDRDAVAASRVETDAVVIPLPTPAPPRRHSPKRGRPVSALAHAATG